MIGKYIRKYRLASQMNQQELAIALDIKQSTIANYEKDIRSPNLEMMIKIADYFNISLDELAGRHTIDYNNSIHISDIFLDSLLNDDIEKAEDIAKRYLEQHGLRALYFKLFRYGLTKLGWLWEVDAITISREHQISYIISRMVANYNLHKTTSDIKFLGMAVPGEKHNIGLQMLMSLLQNEGYGSMNIHTAVPFHDLKKHIDKEGFKYLILSITNVLYKKEMMDLIESLPELQIYVVGNGAREIRFLPQIKGVYTSYEACLEDILWQVNH